MTRLWSLITDAVMWARTHPSLATVLAFAAITLPMVVARGAATAITGWRHARLADHAHQVLITPPPVVEPAGAGVFWATLSELLAASPGRRLVWGNPHVALEYRWTGRRLTICCWVPGPVPARLVAAAARAAWPGATTTVENAVPPVPVRAGGRVGSAGAAAVRPDFCPTVGSWLPGCRPGTRCAPTTTPTRCGR